MITVRTQPNPLPSHPTASLILSLIFLTWVMAFVIPNDSRNKSTVMRSHWVPLFFFSFLWNHPSQLRTINLRSETQTGTWIWAPVNQHETDQFPRQEDLPATKMDTLYFRACLFPFSSTQRFIISWLTGAHILSSCWCCPLCFQTLPFDSFSMFIDSFRFSSGCSCRLLSCLIYDNAIIYNRRRMCVCMHEHSHPHNDVWVSWLEQDVCTNTSLRFVRAISLQRVNCG